MKNHNPNRWKGFILGAAGGGVGVIAMSYYWKAAAALAGGDPRQARRQQDQQNGTQAQPLDSISLIGEHHAEGESSTAAMGRIAYRLLTGKEPRTEETRTTLSYLMHWIFSMFTAGVYGAVRGPTAVPDWKGGLALALGLWGLGDELAVPLLGLAGGPTAYPPALHAHALGAHIAYGLATATTTQTLQRLF